MNYEFDFHFLSGNFGVLWDGLKVTLQLALISNVVGLVQWASGARRSTDLSLNNWRRVQGRASWFDGSGRSGGSAASNNRTRLGVWHASDWRRS